MKRAALMSVFSTVLLLRSWLDGQAQTLDALIGKAQTAQTDGDYGQAAILYRRATTASPGTAELWSNLGVMEFLTGQLDSAAADLHHALKLKPDLFASLLFLGKVYVGEKKPAQALPYLLRAQTLQPQDVEVLRSLGKAYEALHRFPDAAVAYRSATEREPTDAGGWLGLGSSALELIAQDGRTLARVAPNSTWARALYADELLAQGRPLEAIDIYHAALGSSTPSERALLASMLSYMQSHQSQFPLASKSQAALQQLVNESQVSPSGVKQTTDDKAALCPERHTDGAQASPVNGAACAFLANDYAESAANAQRALRQAPENTEALYWSVKANERTAVQALARVDDLAPNSPVTHDLVGDLYRYQQQWDNAITEYNRALSLNPHDAAALLGAATTYFSLSRYDEAIATVQTALVDRPLDPKSNLLMAEILSAQGHEDQVAPFLAHCGNVAPELQARVHYLRGRAAAKAGNLQEAIREMVLAVPGDTDGSMHFQLSRLYRRSGDVQKAQMVETEAKALVNQREVNAAIALREAISANP